MRFKAKDMAPFRQSSEESESYLHCVSCPELPQFALMKFLAIQSNCSETPLHYGEVEKKMAESGQL